MTQEQAYATWWWEEGSGILPLPTEDMEEFAHRITQISWSNAAFIEKERIIKAIERLGTWAHISEVVAEIRGEQA